MSEKPKFELYTRSADEIKCAVNNHSEGANPGTVWCVKPDRVFIPLEGEGGLEEIIEKYESRLKALDPLDADVVINEIKEFTEQIKSQITEGQEDG